MNFDEAITCHTSWNMKLARYLAKPDHSLNAAAVGSPVQCELGEADQRRREKALQPAGIRGHGYRPHGLHKAAADVIRKADSGNRLAEEIALGAKSEFASASNAVVRSLMTLKSKVQIARAEGLTVVLRKRPAGRFVCFLICVALPEAAALPLRGEIAAIRFLYAFIISLICHWSKSSCSSITTPFNARRLRCVDQRTCQVAVQASGRVSGQRPRSSHNCSLTTTGYPFIQCILPRRVIRPRWSARVSRRRFEGFEVEGFYFVTWCFTLAPVTRITERMTTAAPASM